MALRGQLLVAVAHNVSADTMAGVSQLVAVVVVVVVVAEGFCEKLHHHP